VDTNEILFEKARQFHGSLCLGILLGTRLAILGMRALGMEPRVRNRDLMVFVETDRCVTDAIQAVTGCSLGHRTLKYINYGKAAATFLDLKTNKAVRVSVRGNPGGNKGSIEVFKTVPEEALFMIREVKVELGRGDMPGNPYRKDQCAQCGEMVLDGRVVVQEGKTLCRACADSAYYLPVDAGK
jgi:formylmethanofuran dehydrogenase subunit E